MVARRGRPPRRERDRGSAVAARRPAARRPPSDAGAAAAFVAVALSAALAAAASGAPAADAFVAPLRARAAARPSRRTRPDAPSSSSSPGFGGAGSPRGAFGAEFGRRGGFGGRGAVRSVRPGDGGPSFSSSSSSSTRLHLLKGLVSSVDDLIAEEEEEARRSPVSVLASTFRAMTTAPSPGDALVIFREEMTKLVERTKASTGDTESKIQLLRGNRSYANEGLIDRDVGDVPPVLDDLNQPDPSFSTSYWVSPPFRMTVIAGSFFFFPFLTDFLRSVIDVSPDEYDIINGQFGPGVGVLYGTFTALTLEILYQRQCNIQENSTLEASLLAQVTQNVLSLFRDDPAVAREASQIVADQVRVIASRSRGAEMLTIMRADPYARILSLVDKFHKSKDYFTLQEEALIECLRGEIPQLMESRAKRLSDEASELPPTHFLVLTLLTGLSLIGFTTATLTIVGDDGKPPLESRLVFAGLTAIFFLFYNFCRDLNNPFGGVYQIKRAGAASYLLQIKYLVAKQPFADEVRFDSGGYRQSFDGPDLACEDECVIECDEEEDEYCGPAAAASVGGAVLDATAVETTAVVVEAEVAEDAEVLCVEDECSIDEDEVLLLDDWDDADEEDLEEWGYYDDYYDEDEAYVPASSGSEPSVEVASAAAAAGTIAVVASAAASAESSSPPSAPLPPGSNPAVLYFLGTSGFGSTAAETEAAVVVEEADTLLGSTEVLRADELRRRKMLIEKRSRFGEDWEHEALGERDVQARSEVSRDGWEKIAVMENIKYATEHLEKIDKSADAGKAETGKSAEEEEKAKAATAKAKAEANARAEEEEAKMRAEDEAKLRAEEEARKRAEEEAAAAEAEAERIAEDEARRKAAEAKAEAERAAEETAAAAAAEQAAREAEQLQREAEEEEEERRRRRAARDAYDSTLRALKDPATGASFPPKLDDDLYLLGVGVRRRAIVNVYSVGAYSSYDARTSLSDLSPRGNKKEALERLRSAVKSARRTSFLLDMTFKASAEAMAGAIADSVAPRHAGDRADVDELKKIILDGVKKVKKGGAATKGTTFRFDCAEDRLSVSVDDEMVGSVPSPSLSNAFCDVYLDDKAVSPALRDSVVENCLG